jgi:acyl-CoA synthetase (AMP-forming)/AMP-acid ligase II
MLLNFCQALLPTLSAQSGETELVCWPDAAALPPLRLSATELRTQVAAAHAALAKQGVQPGQMVLVLVPMSPGLLVALLALLSLGAVPVLPHAGASTLALWKLTRHPSLRMAVVADNLASSWRWLARLSGRRLVPLPPAGSVAADAVFWQPQLVPAAQPALVSYSSGSTGGGRPHAVQRSHGVLLAQHTALKKVFPPQPGQRDFPLFPNVLLHNLAAGTTTIIPDLPWATGWANFDPARVLAQLAAERVTTLTGNVFYFQKLLAHLTAYPATFHLVQAVGVGGSPVPEGLLPELKKAFPNADCYVIYGCSEAEPIAVRRASPAPADPRLGYSVGHVHPDITLKLAAPQPLWLPADSSIGAAGQNAGEILVQGPHVARPTGTEWLATGDFGYLDAAGQLFLVGRRGAGGPVRGIWHYQVEHVARQAIGAGLVAARPTLSQLAFDVFVQGTEASAKAVRRALTVAFGEDIIGTLHLREHLPVDGRHFSKIRYDLLQ